LRDSIFECSHCEAENFFNLDRVKMKQALEPCWSCGKPPQLPSRMRITGAHSPYLVMLSRGAQLFAHHLAGDEYNFSTVMAEVAVNPRGLKNLTASSWRATMADKTSLEMRPGSVLPLSDGCRIHFGKAEAEIKL
jgi:eukaryotic-like serine/threonine-protein kinase